MLNILKQAAPYVLLVMMAGWSFSLQREVASLEASNTALVASFAELSTQTAANDRAVEEWVVAHESVAERTGNIHAKLAQVENNDWGAAPLPDEYVRVLREAGILDGRRDAPVDPAPRGGDTKADRHDEQGTAPVRTGR